MHSIKQLCINAFVYRQVTNEREKQHKVSSKGFRPPPSHQKSNFSFGINTTSLWNCTGERNIIFQRYLRSWHFEDDGRECWRTHRSTVSHRCLIGLRSVPPSPSVYSRSQFVSCIWRWSHLESVHSE